MEIEQRQEILARLRQRRENARRRGGGPQQQQQQQPENWEEILPPEILEELRGGGQGQVHLRHEQQRLEQQNNIQQVRTLFGTGRDGMVVVDPDLPLVELFWRSLLPWARVDGVPPGRLQ
mmetsp:Transcript_20595/g.23879  ORF Transcript_20595/g.23879 Transcript_20595/m.23879 type:complete len:120 (-) Transcript_20595:88-447(-)